MGIHCGIDEVENYSGGAKKETRHQHSTSEAIFEILHHCMLECVCRVNVVKNSSLGNVVKIPEIES